MSVLKELERQIASLQMLRDDGVPSVSMAMLDSSGEIQAHVIGGSNENTATLYQACSISKAITALAIAKLVDLGTFSYEDKIVDHVPRHRLEELGKTERDMETITVASLVSHRSGLSQHGFPGYPEHSEIPSIEAIYNGHSPSTTPRIRFSSLPFAQFSYSGGGYLLLQVFLECVLEKPFAQLMYDVVLAPLNMSRSSYTTALPDGEQNYARAYITGTQRANLTSRGYHSFPEAAAAGLWTTPTDLLKAVAAVQHSLTHDQGFLSKGTARRMLTKVSPNQDTYSMAMGWGSDGRFFGHCGDNDPGFCTYVFGSHGGVVNRQASCQPSEKAGISGEAFAILTNSVLGFPTIKKIIAAVFYLQHWPSAASLPGHYGLMTDYVPYATPPGTPFSNAWKAWSGQWQGGWVIIDDADAPKILFPSIKEPILLRPAAMTAPSNGGDQAEQILVAEGYEIAIRLSYHNSVRTLSIIQSEGVQVVDRPSIV